MKKTLSISVLLLAGISCNSQNASTSASTENYNACAVPTPAKKVEIPTTGVRSITLPVMQTNIPAKPGMASVIATCTLCHSQRYVLTQPNFPRKTWIAEVDKMKKVYGAPIQDDQVEPIVNYLVSIRGTGQ